MSRRSNRPLSTAVESLANYLTIIGIAGTMSVVVRFLMSSPYIRLSNTGIWGVTIQGVPFVWIVSSITLVNARNFLNAFKAMTQSKDGSIYLLLGIVTLTIASLVYLRTIQKNLEGD
jgi:hypothetical protein